MTDLNKLLYVAEKMLPNIRNKRQWMIGHNLGEPAVIDVLMSKDPMGIYTAYEPHKPTERGKAQLMDIVFAIRNKAGFIVLADDKTEAGRLFCESLNKLPLKASREQCPRWEIINLAAEVL